MAFELAQIAPNAQSNQPSQPAPREERVVSMYAQSDESRYANALAKLKGQATTETQSDIKNNAADINDKADESPAGGVSLPLSPQLAALARKEQKFRQEQVAHRAKELALEADRKEIAELKALKAKLAANDYSDIDKLVDYEKLVQHKLGKDPRAEELEKVRADIAAMKAAQEKDVNERFEAAINQRKTAVKALIASNPEYSTIKELNAEEAVVQHILNTWENDEIELSPEEAAKEVEAALLEKANKWTSLSKLKPKETELAKAAPEKKELPPLKSGMNTLTNNMAATGEIKRPTKPLHLMTEQERYAEAYRRAQEKAQQGIR